MTDCSTNPESTTSSLVSSTTTETKPTTTEESPTTLEPDPYAAEFNYVVINEETHVACIAANMTIFMKISYETEESGVRIYLFERSLRFSVYHITLQSYIYINRIYAYFYPINLDPDF